MVWMSVVTALAGGLSFGENDGRVGVFWEGVELYRGAPSCTTSRDCIRTARTLSDWPSWQRPTVADHLLGPHCEEGDLWACVASEGVRRDDESAWSCIDEPASCLAFVEQVPDSVHVPALLEETCEAEVGEACVRRGELAEDAERLKWWTAGCALDVGCAERDALAERLEREALAERCASDGAACLELAERLEEGETFQDRRPEGWVLEACVVGDATGCRAFEMQTGRWGLEDGVVRDMLDELEGRCAAEPMDAGACRVAGSLLRRTRVRDARYGMALDRLQRACEGGDGLACLEGGTYRRIGKARRHPFARESFWATGCSGGHAASCTASGEHLVQRRRTREEGYTVLQSACDEGEGRACGLVGVASERRDPERATALFTQSCEASDGLGCRKLGELQLGRDKLVPEHEAFVALSEACDERDALACMTVARAHARRKTSYDEEERYRRTKEGCEAGSVDGVLACRAQARLLKRGIGVERDRGEARVLAKAYSRKRPPRMLRVTLGAGVPALTNYGFEGLLPFRLPIGRLSVHGELSRVAMSEDGPIGGLLDTAGGATHSALVARYYLSRAGSGLYFGAGLNAQSAWLDLVEVPKADPVAWMGPTVRLGYHAQRGVVGAGLEVGVMVVPDEMELGIPLLPTVALRLGFSPR